eukprot:g27103.t1
MAASDDDTVSERSSSEGEYPVFERGAAAAAADAFRLAAFDPDCGRHRRLGTGDRAEGLTYLHFMWQGQDGEPGGRQQELTGKMGVNRLKRQVKVHRKACPLGKDIH